MPDTQTVMFEGKPNVFPADFTEAEISAALGAIPAANAAQAPKAKTWAPVVATVGKGVAPAAEVLAEFGTNPNVAKGAATVGRAVGAATSLPASLSGFGSMQKGAYAGGKSGYFTGKLAQDVARPLSTALEKIAPYAQTLGTLGGAQSALDVAQLAEPNRKDIGTLGMTLGDAHDPNHPALLNLLAMKAGDAIKYLISEGLSLGEASRTYWNAKAKASK